VAFGYSSQRQRLRGDKSLAIGTSASELLPVADRLISKRSGQHDCVNHVGAKVTIILLSPPILSNVRRTAKYPLNWDFTGR
jgi:hypothetical protein